MRYWRGACTLPRSLRRLRKAYWLRLSLFLSFLFIAQMRPFVYIPFSIERFLV